MGELRSKSTRNLIDLARGASSLARFALAYIREENFCYDAHRRPKIQACKE
mgnify:CR=1